MVDSITKAYLSIGIKQEPIQEEVIQLDEELNQTEKDMARRMMGSGHSYYRQAFLKQHPVAEDAFKNHPDTKQWTHRVPIDMVESAKEPHFGVMSFLKGKGYSSTPEDYKAGITKSSIQVNHPVHGLQEKIVEHKIGGILEKHKEPDLKKAYDNDPFRIGAKTKAFDFILTGHPEDVLAGSTGQGYISCANVRTKDSRDKFQGKGPAAKCMPEEISQHTHHVYLVPRGGSVENDVIGRTSYKMHKGLGTGHETLFPENRVYGTVPDWFLPKSNELVSKMFTKKHDVYKKVDGVYSDNGQDYQFPENPTGEHLDLAWKAVATDKDEHKKAKVIGLVNPDHKYKSKTLRDAANHLKGIREANKTGDFDKITESLTLADRGIDATTKLQMSMNNPHYQALVEHAASQFNLDRPDHVRRLSEVAIGRNVFSNQFRTDFLGKISRNLPEAKTMDQYMSLAKLKTNGMYIRDSYSGVKIHSDHKLGRYPFESIIKAHSEQGTLNPESYQMAYHSTYGLNRKKGNLYDSTVRHEREAVPGMSAIVDHWAHQLNKRAWMDNGTYEDNLAVSFHRMMPSTRERIASVIGVDHKDIMKKGKSGIQKEKERDKLLGR